MASHCVEASFLQTFAQVIEEFCLANGVSPAIYFRDGPGLQGLLRLEIDRKHPERKRERFRQALRHPQMFHQRRQANSDFERTVWLGNPRSVPEAQALYRRHVAAIIPPLHRELVWASTMFAHEFPIAGPRPLWTYDVHSLVRDHASDIAAVFGVDPNAVDSSEDDMGNFAIASQERLLAGRFELPFGTMMQDRLNTYLVTPYHLPDDVVGATLGELLPIGKKLPSASLVVLAKAQALGGTRLRIGDQWMAAAPLPPGQADWREPFIIPTAWTS